MRVPLLVAILAAGCVGQPLEGASVESATDVLPFDIDVTAPERLTLQVADGTKLDLAVIRPQGDEPAPVIVDIGPYFGNLAGDIMTFTAVDLRLAEYFVPRGYAVARASVRGTGASEGCFDLGGKTEQEDVREIVDFLGTQPWSNGNVAVFGKSYDGTTPWMAAISQPEHLRTIVPISGITDWYRYMFYDGVAYPEELGFNALYYLLVDMDVDTGFEGTQPPGQPTLFNDDPQHHLSKNLIRTCEGLGEQTLWQSASTATGDHGEDFWTERDYERSLDKVQVPVFMVHGLQDWNVKPDNEVPLWNDLDVPKALWIGQWAHDYPDINRYDADWSRHDWNETLLVWFDHWLKGVDNEWESLAHVEAQDQLGTWTNYTAWPPEEAVEVGLVPSADKKLLAGADAGVATVRDPLGKGFDPATGEGGVAFLTAPLADDITILGTPALDVTLTTDRPAGHLVATLYDVAPDGTWTQIDHGARDVRHRDSREKGSPATPGAPFAMTIALYPQELTIQKGHALALAIAAEDPDWFVPAPVAPTYTIQLGTDATVLRLLVRDAADAGAVRAALEPAHAAHAAASSPLREIVK